MNRRYFLQNSVAAAAAPQVPPAARETESGGTGSTSYQARVEIERRQSGTPHKGKVFAAMWRKMGVGLQLVSTHDIGVFAALAFADPVSPVFRNNAISLAGDKMTQAQASEHFQKVFSQKMPIAFSFLGCFTQFMVKELGMMFQWFREVGYKADVEKCRQLHPAMQNFETWLMHESKFKKIKRLRKG